MEDTPTPVGWRPPRREPSAARQLVLVGLIALGLGLVGYLTTRSGKDEAVDRHVDELSRKLTADSASDAHAAIVDEDYRFRIEWPGGEWKLLPEDEIGRLNPQAAAGAIGPRGRFGMVLVEELPSPDTDLEEWANLLMENFLPAGEAPLEFGPVTFKGQRAMRYHILIKVGEMELRVINHVFFHQGHAYQVAGTGPAAWSDPGGRDVQPFFDAFSLLPGPVKGRRLEQVLTDAEGVGWEVRDGVYESGAFGLRVKPPTGWRFELGENVELYAESAEFAMTSQDPEMWVAVTPEATRGVDPDVYRELMTRGFSESFELLPGTWDFRLFGRPISFKRYRETTVYDSDYLVGLARAGDDHFLILAGFASATADRAKARLGEVIASIERLPPGDRWELSRRLLDDGSPEDAIGVDWSWRRGRLLDFRVGVEWRAPRGFWRVTAGDQARTEFDADTVFVGEEPALGINAYLTVYPLDSADPDLHHQGVVEEWAGYSGLPADGVETERIPLAGGRGRASWLQGGEEGRELRYRIFSVVRGNRGVQLVISGFRGNVNAAEETIAQAAKGLSVPVGGLQAVTGSGTGLVDRRMGFSFDLPGLRFKPYGASQLRALGSAWTAKSGRRTVMVFAICALNPSQDMDWLTDLLTQQLRARTSDASRSLSTKERSTLAGQPCDKLSFGKARRMAEILVLRRDRTFYVLLETTENPRSDPVDVEALKRSFRLLD